MWTRHDIKEFKREVSSFKGDGIIVVGHGDTVTVRVPTLEGGSSLFWEFATDNYDIGFGVYFEWGKVTSTEVSVHVSESDDEDDLLEEDDEGKSENGRGDLIIQIENQFYVDYRNYYFGGLGVGFPNGSSPYTNLCNLCKQITNFNNYSGLQKRMPK